MTLRAIIVSLILCLALTFTPIENLQCSSTFTGTKTNEISSETILSTNIGFKKLGQFRSGAVISGKQHTLNCFLFGKGDVYRAQCFDPELTLFAQEYVSANPTQFLESYDAYILVKEFTDATKTDYTYAVYWFDNFNGRATQPLMARFTITREPGLQFNKFLHWENWQDVTMVFTSSAKTQLWTINQFSDGTPTSKRLVANSKVDALGGSKRLIFDKLTNTFLQVSAVETQPFTVVQPKTTTTGTQFGSVIVGTLGFNKMRENKFVITSFSQSGSVFDAHYGVYDDSDQVLASGSFTGGDFAPVSFGNYENFILVAKGCLVWVRVYAYPSMTTKMNVFANLELESPDFLTAQEDFKAALAVDFNKDKAFILSNQKIVIYEIQASGTQKISEVALSPTTQGQINGGVEISLKMSIACKCTEVKVSGFVCFADSLKCISQVAPIETVCTVPYVDLNP